MTPKAPVLVLAGPTAVGKTALALEASRRTGADIISADSRQVYRHLDIGTAKPTPEEQRLARHHLIDIVEPGQEYSAAAFARDARTVMERLEEMGRPFLVAGGSGLYIKALMEGLSEMPPVDPEISRRLRQEAAVSGTESLYRRLSRVDGETAGRLKPADRARVVRALEVLESTGRPISYWQKRPRKADGWRYRMVVLSRGRDELYRRIDRRTERMIADGLLDEVRRLVDHGFRQALEAVKAVGYREAVAHIDGLIDLPSMVDTIKQNTRRFAKRQLTWFRGVAAAEWLDVSDAEAAIERLMSRQRGKGA